jgi:hypothetical protein
MTPWIVTKRRDRDFLVHRVGELRGICTTWEQDHADRIAAALNSENCGVGEVHHG